MKRKRSEKPGPFALKVEHVAPTAQQAEAVGEGLRILAAWLVRRYRREVAAGSALTSGSKGAPLSGDPEATPGT